MAEAIAPVIAFNEVPDQLRIPGVWIEFDARLAGQSVFAAKACIIGQRLTTGTVPAGQPVRVSANGAATDALFGRGSMLAEMVKAAKTARPWLEIWAIGLDDNGAGVAAKKKLAITGPATEAGTLNVYIGFYRVQIAVAAADTAATLAARLAAAINLLTTCPMTAAVNGTNSNEVDLTCRWKGETGSDIDVRVGYYSSDKTPAGLSFTITAPVAGSGNPDVTPAIDAMGDDWYNWIACAYTDGANMVKLETELGSRFGPMRAIGGRLFTAYAGTHAAIGTFGNAHNSQHATCMGAGKSPTPPWIWAAVYMAEAGHSLGIDPARQLRGRILQGVAAPAKADRWDNTQRNELLFDGIATTTVSSDGTVRIEAEISMYQENAGGLGDDAWLYINTPETLERIRLEQRHYFTQRYPDWKLAEDDYDVPPGQPIMQPKKAITELLGLYHDVFMRKGWTQDFEGYKATILAAININNRNRLDVYDSPKLINNMRLMAMHTEFR